MSSEPLELSGQKFFAFLSTCKHQVLRAPVPEVGPRPMWELRRLQLIVRPSLMGAEI